MMSLQVVSENIVLLQEVADFLLEEGLVANALLSNESEYRFHGESGIESKKVFLLKCISKSLLFSLINERLREKYGDRMPLVYSEPIIMIDPEQRDDLLARLTKV
ncbi:MAG: hypothetical protein KTR22_06395 [Flavobacteriaceae bacterium]|nr:hypothetical protein [Flavobacteriaceae bacterium]